MGFMDKFKGFMGVPDDEYFEDEELAEYDDEEQEPEEDYTAFGNMRRDSYREPEPDFTAPKKDNKVVNIHATTQLQVVLVKPERFEDASTIADHLNGKRTVVLNLEAATQDLKRRLVDFLSGVAYANGGQIKKVANSTYIITPYNVGVIGDSLLDELESNGVYF